MADDTCVLEFENVAHASLEVRSSSRNGLVARTPPLTFASFRFVSKANDMILLLVSITVFGFVHSCVDAQVETESASQRPSSLNQVSDESVQFTSMAEFNAIDPDQIRTPSELEPVVSEAPPAFLRLVDKGRVRFTRNDALLKEQQKSALTLFWFQVQFRQLVNYRIARRNVDGSVDLRVNTRFGRTSYSIAHLIVLPSWFQVDSASRSKLLQHEFDHVAITTDPRAKKIAESFLWQPDEWDYRIEAGERFSQEDLNAEAKRRFEDRKLVFQEMLQNIYDQLDDVSEQGQRDINARTEFFTGIFELENLEELKFPVSRSLRKKINSRNYSRIERHYELLW